MIKITYDDWRGERTYRDVEEFIFESLVLRELDFNKISEQYIAYLQCQEDFHKKQLAEADYPLMQIIDPVRSLDAKTSKDTIYRYLVKYERFKGAPIWDEMVKYVEENNINLKGSYFTDLYLEEGEKSR